MFSKYAETCFMLMMQRRDNTAARAQRKSGKLENETSNLKLS